MPQGVSLFCSRPCTQSPLCAQSVPMSVIAPSSPPAPRSRLALYLDLIRFNRPAGWLVLIWPTLTALWVAADGFPGWHLLLVFGLGTVLMRSAGCTINDIADRNFDKHVKRTTARPITSGELSVKEAALVGAVLALLALGLVLTTRWEAVAWSVPAVLFTILYPYTKRFFAMPQAFLGIAFNFGIVIAFALTAVHLIGISLTGTSVNPARSIGPALFAGGAALSNLWVFIVGPSIGGILAGLCWKSIKNK